VVLVQHLPGKKVKRVYLDRMQPKVGPCPRTTGVPINCGNCAEGPGAWAFTIGGIGTAGCCLDYNGTWTLKHVPGTCTWETDEPDPCGSGRKAWTLKYNAADTFWELSAKSPTLIQSAAYYKVHRDSYRCLEANTWDRTAVNLCLGWPATVTVNPL
jgi:hypothetical protein